MKKQIFGLMWSIFVMANIVFVIFFLFSVLDAVITIFLPNE